MCGEVDNIFKWSIGIKPSDELIRIILKTCKTNKGLSKDQKMQYDNLQINYKGLKFTTNELLILKKLENVVLEKEDLIQQMNNSNALGLDLKNNKEFVDGDSGCQGKEMCDIFRLSNLNLQLTHIKWLYNSIVEMNEKDVKYLHDVLVECIIILPKNILNRNPILEARCQILRARQENEKYKKMTKNIDSTRSTLPEDTISYQVKAINKQLIAVLQFIFSVAAGFAFGFIGIELIIGNMDFGFRLLLGIICALTIALAEMYFLAKKLNEMDKCTTDQYLAKKNE